MNSYQKQYADALRMAIKRKTKKDADEWLDLPPSGLMFGQFDAVDAEQEFDMTITLHVAQHFHRVVGIVQYVTAGRGQYRVFSHFQRTVRNIGHEEPDFRGFQPVAPEHRAYESRSGKAHTAGGLLRPDFDGATRRRIVRCRPANPSKPVSVPPRWWTCPWFASFLCLKALYV